MKNVLPAALLLSLSFLAACSKESDYDYHVTGRVLSSVDSTPLANTAFKLTSTKPKVMKAEEISQQLVTDGNGDFDIIYNTRGGDKNFRLCWPDQNRESGFATAWAIDGKEVRFCEVYTQP